MHSLADDHSRLAYSEILPDERGRTCAAFLLRAAASFAAAGITRIERVMTDNHWSYTKSEDIREAMATLGAKHKLIRAHCPWQNGKVERFNRTLQTEWPTARYSTPTVSGQPHLRPGWTTTTLDAATPHSVDCRRSADCHQRDGRVQLAAGPWTQRSRQASMPVVPWRRLWRIAALRAISPLIRPSCG